MASARIFSNLSHSKKYDVYIFIIGDEEKGSIEFKTQLNILKNLNIETANLTENNFDVFKKIINKDCCVIDALFGIGLKRNISGIYKRAIEVVNEKAEYCYHRYQYVEYEQFGGIFHYQRKNPDIFVVILTGYDYFEYAQTSIRVKVDDYILKPISKLDIESVLKKIINTISEKNKKNE